MGIGDFFKDVFGGGEKFKSGPLKKPTKFEMVCGHGPQHQVRMSIKPGMAEPVVLVECSCGKGEALYVL